MRRAYLVNLVISGIIAWSVGSPLSHACAPLDDSSNIYSIVEHPFGEAIQVILSSEVTLDLERSYLSQMLRDDGSEVARHPIKLSATYQFDHGRDHVFIETAEALDPSSLGEDRDLFQLVLYTAGGDQDEPSMSFPFWYSVSVTSSTSELPLSHDQLQMVIKRANVDDLCGSLEEKYEFKLSGALRDQARWLTINQWIFKVEIDEAGEFTLRYNNYNAYPFTRTSPDMCLGSLSLIDTHGVELPISWEACGICEMQASEVSVSRRPEFCENVARPPEEISDANEEVDANDDADANEEVDANDDADANEAEPESSVIPHQSGCQSLHRSPKKSPLMIWVILICLGINLRTQTRRSKIAQFHHI